MNTTSWMEIRKRRVPRCPCGCGERGLCHDHRARLAEIRERLAEDTKKLPVRRASYRAGDGSGRGPTCTTPGCYGSRPPSLMFCSDCLDNAE